MAPSDPLNESVQFHERMTWPDWPPPVMPTKYVVNCMYAPGASAAPPQKASRAAVIFACWIWVRGPGGSKQGSITVSWKCNCVVVLTIRELGSWGAAQGMPGVSAVMYW